MKKLTSKLLLLVMVLAMAFSLAACGSKKGDSKEMDQKENVAKQESQSEKKDQAQNEDDKKGSSLYDSVADYVNSDTLQSVLNSLKSSFQEGMSIDLVAEGDNKLVYIYTYETITHTEGDGMAEALESAIGAKDTTFQQTADSIKSFVGNDEVIVEIRYVDMNGAVIFSKIYTSE